MQRVDVRSSMIRSVGYDPATHVLEVQFANTGHVYVYPDVPEELHEAMMGANSVGAFFSREIRPNFPGKDITDDLPPPTTHDEAPGPAPVIPEGANAFEYTDEDAARTGYRKWFEVDGVCVGYELLDGTLQAYIQPEQPELRQPAGRELVTFDLEDFGDQPPAPAPEGNPSGDVASE